MKTRPERAWKKYLAKYLDEFGSYASGCGFADSSGFSPKNNS